MDPYAANSKICPRCRGSSPLGARSCPCGHVYRTQFPASPDQTVLGGSYTPYTPLAPGPSAGVPSQPRWGPRKLGVLALTLIVLVTVLVLGSRYFLRPDVTWITPPPNVAAPRMPYPACPYCRMPVAVRSTACPYCGREFRWKTLPCPQCQGKKRVPCPACGGAAETTVDCSNCEGFKEIVFRYQRGNIQEWEPYQPNRATGKCGQFLANDHGERLGYSGKAEPYLREPPIFRYFDCPECETGKVQVKCKTCRGTGQVDCDVCAGIGALGVRPTAVLLPSHP